MIYLGINQYKISFQTGKLLYCHSRSLTTCCIHNYTCNGYEGQEVVYFSFVGWGRWVASIQLDSKNLYLRLNDFTKLVNCVCACETFSSNFSFNLSKGTFCTPSPCIFDFFHHYSNKSYTVFQRSLDPYYIVTYYIGWDIEYLSHDTLVLMGT